jgi:hypothetical protein
VLFPYSAGEFYGAFFLGLQPVQNRGDRGEEGKRRWRMENGADDLKFEISDFTAEGERGRGDEWRGTGASCQGKEGWIFGWLDGALPQASVFVKTTTRQGDGAAPLAL